jgi:hypothetical protein
VSKRDPWEEWDDVLGGLEPETDAELYEVAIDREMTLAIGLAARCHVALDQVLHATITALTGTSMPSGASTSSLIRRIEETIEETSLPGDPQLMTRHETHCQRRVLPINVGTVCSTMSG